MKIPKTVKIGWRTYTVKLIDGIIDDYERLLNGEMDFTNHVINLDRNIVDENEKKLTFLHEVVHGIFHGQGHLEWRDNEELVQSVAEGLFQLIKDNPKVLSE